MPNRIIKESICTSDTLAQLTAEEERLFYRLIVQADDWGRFDGRPQVILAACFPLQLDRITSADVEAWLQRLVDVGLIRFYYAAGRRYLEFVTWERHQQKRAKYSKYPHPPACEANVQSADINCNQMPAIVPENRETRIENRETRNEEERESLSPDEPAPPSPQEIADLWNEICGDVLPKCEKMTDKRRKHIKARLAESQERHSLDWWHGYFSRIRASPFCCGQNDRGWCATFEWAICSEDNVVKVLEGKYDRKRGDLVAIRPERGPVGGVSRGPDPNSKYAAVYR